MPLLPYPVTLGSLVRERAEIHASCNRCGLDERMDVAEALAFHGPETTVWEVVEAMKSECPRGEETRPYEICGICCPTLLEVQMP